MKSIKWITGLTLAALAALTIFFAPSYLASAQAQGPDADGVAQAQNRGERFGQRGQRGQGMSVVADLLGLSGEELRAELQAGKSIADVAAEQGVALETIENALIDQLSTHLAEKVANGDLTQEEADARLAEAGSRISERLTQTFDGNGPRGRRGQRGHRGQMMSTIADLLGLEGEQLRTELQAGKSIADVAAEQGVALETIENALIDQLNTKLAEKVANGDLTQEEADARLAEASSRINEHLSQTFDGNRPNRFGPRGQRGQGGAANGFATSDS